MIKVNLFSIWGDNEKTLIGNLLNNYAFTFSYSSLLWGLAKTTPEDLITKYIVDFSQNLKKNNNLKVLIRTLKKIYIYIYVTFHTG